MSRNKTDERLSAERLAGDGQDKWVSKLLHYVALEDIPASRDLFSPAELEAYLGDLAEPPFSLIVAGDIMLGGRARRAISEFGVDYPFAAVLPLLRHARIVLGNLEGPFARRARKVRRRHDELRPYVYGVNPELAHSLARAGISVVTLANNHLLDCGRAGVLETLDALTTAGVMALGAATNEQAARAPLVLPAGEMRVGLLGYYWNHRTAATATLPGSAMDSPEALEADICSLRGRVDRIVVTFHWGIPYEGEPSAQDRVKARYAIECGADAVIGHHPHVLQPFEIYRGKPIFYSVGNFAFGSGNSRGEGMLVGLRFNEEETVVGAYPLYVKNRDPRVQYQPKLLKGGGAQRVLSRLAAISGADASFKIEEGRATLHLPR